MTRWQIITDEQMRYPVAEELTGIEEQVSAGLLTDVRNSNNSVTRSSTRTKCIQL